jgi:acetyltransferase-like isoleucine patch superfamily enzyme
MMNRSEMERQGLLQIGSNCRISDAVAFEIVDLVGDSHPIVIGDNCRIMPFTIIHGGVRMRDGVVIESHAVIGQPEFGYAVGRNYGGWASKTEIGGGVIVRGGATVYGGVSLGDNTTIGHRTLLRSDVRVGANTQLAHGMSIERDCRIGNHVRCSPLSHITSSIVMEDRVFIGAGVVTINDKGMIWRDPKKEPELIPPYFEYAAKIGSGSVIAAGVRIGRNSLIGSGSVVTHDIPADVIAFGVPAKVKGLLGRSG